MEASVDIDSVKSREDEPATNRPIFAADLAEALQDLPFEEL